MRQAQTIEFDEFLVSPDTGEIFRKGQRVSLQNKPFELLMALLERPGEMVTRQELYARLWPRVNVSYRPGLDTAARKLRRSLGDRAFCIETLPRRGYRLKTASSVSERACEPAERIVA